MPYTHTHAQDVSREEKFGIHLEVYPDLKDFGLVIAETETGHNQEFYDTASTFHYVILDGGGSFFLDDKEVAVSKGDLISIEPGTRIYYKGKMRILLLTNPAWRAENEVETREQIW